MRVVLVLVAVVLLPFACSNDKGVGPGDVNHPPVIDHMRDTTAVIGDTLKIQVPASDPDEDELHFNLLYDCSWADILQDLCPHAGIHITGAVFWYWPRASDGALRRFTIIVTDGRGGSDSTGFAVTVSAH